MWVSVLVGAAIVATLPWASLSVNGVPQQPDTTILRMIVGLPALLCLAQGFLTWRAVRWMDRRDLW